jgi:hypothetical protein
MKFLSPILLFLLALNALGQQKLVPVSREPSFEAPLTGESYELKKTSGSQLFLGDWFTGDIILVSGDTVINKEIGYNAYTDELLWRHSQTVLIKLEKEEIERFCLYDKKNNGIFDFCHLLGILLPENRKIDLFARILSVNRLSLFVTYPVECVEKIEQETQGKIIHIEKLEPSKPRYYIGCEAHKYLILNNLNKRSLYKAFPDYKEEIKSIVSQNHQSLKNEKDMIRIMELLNKSETIKIRDS